MKQGGLDTLAALCGGASKARTTESTTNTAPAAPHVKATSAPKPAAPVVVQRSVAPAVQPVSAPIHSPQQPSSAIDPSVQQWQAIATAYGGGGVPNQTAATAAVASILQAATQNPGATNFPQQPTADPNTVNAMQQVAYYQYLAAAQAQAQAQVQAHFAAGQQQQQQQAGNNATTGQPGPGQNGQPNFAMDPNTAAAFGFVSHPAAAHFQMASGTLIFASSHVSPSSFRLFFAFGES